ncbi:MAG: hypothetical protein ACRDN1_16450 [Trebonia sp.]
MTTPRPPDEVFCLTCGPAAALDGDPLAPRGADDTSALTPDETAAQIAAWVRAAVCSGDDA